MTRTHARGWALSGFLLALIACAGDRGSEPFVPTVPDPDPGPAPVPPPFSGTIFIDPDIITPDDPTTFVDMVYAGRGTRLMYDRRGPDWLTLNAFLFTATYDDGLTIEVQINPEFGNPDVAEGPARFYAEAVGLLPTALRRDVKTMWVHQGVEPLQLVFWLLAVAGVVVRFFGVWEVDLMKTLRFIPGLLLASALVGCGDAGSPWSGTITDSAGVVIVANPDAGLWQPEEAWTVHEELRIGALEGPPEVTLGDVGGVAVDSRGRIYVLDDHAQEIRVFSSDGAFLQTVGRRGEGPGELQLAWTPLVGPGDTLFVPDGRLQRLNLFAPDGLGVGSTRWEIEGGRTLAFKATSSGRIAEQVRPLWDPADAPADADGVNDVIVMRSLDGSVADTVLTFPSGEMMGPGGVRAFAAEPRWDVEDGGLLFGAGDQYRISLYMEGRLERVITRPFEPVPVSESDRSAVMREMERRWAEARVPARMLAGVRDRWSFAGSYPAFQELAFGPEGTIWVQRVKTVSELDDAELREWQNARSPEWEVFDHEGRYLGVVTMPDRFRLYEFRGERLYGVARGDQDEPYVVRLRIVRTADGG